MDGAHTDPQLVGPILEADVDSDEAIRSLSSLRRRYVLALLSRRDVPMALADVATDVASWELDTRRDEIPKDAIRSVEVSLYHTDGPMLADVGLLEYDPERRTIELSDRGRAIARRGLPTIEELPRPER